MAHAKCFTRLLPGNALTTILEAQKIFGFKFQTVQSDNGPEFSLWLGDRLRGLGIIHRRTRVHRPNDNAHVERFNRTLREECIGGHMREPIYKTTKDGAALRAINRKLAEYLDFYNNKRLHLGIQCRVPGALAASSSEATNNRSSMLQR